MKMTFSIKIETPNRLRQTCFEQSFSNCETLYRFLVEHCPALADWQKKRLYDSHFMERADHTETEFCGTYIIYSITPTTPKK